MPGLKRRSQAADSDTFSYVRRWGRLREEKGWWHSFELPDGTRIDGVCDLPSLKQRIAQFPIPDNLTGKRVLDIGAWDGWFTFEMERRGADVTAIDCWDNPRFRQMRAMLNSHAAYRIMDVYDINPRTVGTFDIVLFLGVFYHLKHPLLALERVCSVTTDLAAIDSFVLPDEYVPRRGFRNRPLMEFYETTEMGDQTDNWVGPNLACLMAMARTAGFARVDFLRQLDHSACIAGYRRWLPAGRAAQPAPVLLDAFHHTNFGINLTSEKDDYLICAFTSERTGLIVNDVRPTLGPFGSRPIRVLPVGGNEWRVSFKVPPGLPPGWHEVSLHIEDGLESNTRRVAIDLELRCESLLIAALADGATWTLNRLSLAAGGVLTVWLDGLPDNADRNNVEIAIGEHSAEVWYVAPAEGTTPRQVNAKAPPDLPPGNYEVRATVGPAASEPAVLQVTP